ncbi:G-protein coupled receptors family 1 profile domain-containing protein [Caenorhabditis elegans]|nr:G-protein coupled receptors family 1 profile domain-containing protein [Caenorhabditis elegans]CTQ86837.1 G-protein coupled receptors family 1 profile domain-containing protein [Caenorhabditis elegans]|eukprot:NP_001300138.1 Serpentine Receptor, class W [Caenorhabditis elegans]
MALVRLMMIKFGAGLRFQKCSKPAFGFAVIFWCFVFSSMLSSFYYFRYNIIEKGSWGPKDYCTGIPLTTSATIHTQELSQLFTMNDEFFGKSYMFVNGIVSKIIPCILLPFLTVLLIVELQKAEQLRKISSMTKRISSEKTTGLVIFMTVSFFVLELPIGISLIFQVSYTDFGYLYLATYINHVCNSIFIINATSHGVLCFFMSTQYRLTVAQILKIKNNQVTTVHSVQM